jgi:hypothetical protein
MLHISICRSLRNGSAAVDCWRIKHSLHFLFNLPPCTLSCTASCCRIITIVQCDNIKPRRILDRVLAVVTMLGSGRSGVRISSGIRDFWYRLCGITRFIPGGKLAGAWSWSVTVTKIQDKNYWSYASTPPIRLHVVHRYNINFYKKVGKWYSALYDSEGLGLYCCNTNVL